jgi:hypothetical protein
LVPHAATQLCRSARYAHFGFDVADFKYFGEFANTSKPIQGLDAIASALSVCSKQAVHVNIDNLRITQHLSS